MRYKNSLLIAALLSVALPLAACQEGSESSQPIELASMVQHIDGTEFNRVTLSERAIERIDLQTEEVRQTWMDRSQSLRTVVPYSALIYDAEGRTWIYTSPEPRTFVRQAVIVDYIEGDLAVLSQGPAAGTVVASVGVAELYGTEFEVGH
jgi:hypothetical protein